MRKDLRIISFLFITLSLTTFLQAQNDRFAFAVTDLQQTGASWNALRKLDLNTGAYSPVLLNGVDTKQIPIDATTNRPFVSVVDAKFGDYMRAPFSTGVAAMAYDKRDNRLYFTPMFIDQLRYIDLKTMKVYYVTGQAFTGFGSMHHDEGKVITRMTIAPDGNGYAISNDGSIFLKFTTGKKIQVTQLGSLVDDPANGSMSVENRCSSWGGDLVADDAGSLYILSAGNNVFKVNIQTKVATHLAQIKGLAAGFSTNGAVVDADGKLLASSSNSTKSWFVIDPVSWNAMPYFTANGIFRSSDLANSNYLVTKKNWITERPKEKMPDNVLDRMSVYPNPVTNDQFVVQFGKIPTGSYSVDIADVMGRTVLRRTVNVAAEDQAETISVKSVVTKGIYLLKIIDKDSKSVYTQKLVVQ